MGADDRQTKRNKAGKEGNDPTTTKKSFQGKRKLAELAVQQKKKMKSKAGKESKNTKRGKKRSNTGKPKQRIKGPSEQIVDEDHKTVRYFDADAAEPLKTHLRRPKKSRSRHELRKNRLSESELPLMDPFPGKTPIPMERIKKYKRGTRIALSGIKTKFAKTNHALKERKLKFAAEQAARSELLLLEQKGFLEAEDGEDTFRVTQQQIVKAVDITSATKHFNLKLIEFGPYHFDYNRNGQHLLLGGRKGHIAAFNWVSKALTCEFSVMEEVHDVRWLHQETMFAVAQKEWLHVYDNQGVELHCVKKMDRILRMEFLPHHFILATSNEKGYLTWLDVSIGEIVAQFPTKLGRLDVMCQNPGNALIHLGHSKGVVTMWSPNIKEAAVTMMCHQRPIRAVAVDFTGNYMATAAVDRTLKLWDLRNYKCLQSCQIMGGASSLSFSQTGLLAAGIGSTVQVYRDCFSSPLENPYMQHRDNETIAELRFCPYEDVLGMGHLGGFTSLIVPGSGEANFDSLESNPFQSKVQRREAEIKALLGKVPAAMIDLDTKQIVKFHKSDRSANPTTSGNSSKRKTK